MSATSPFWIANNGTGTSTLYNDTGAAIPLVVKIPAAAGATTPGKVTGVIFNENANSFLVSGQTPLFIFCAEDGTISGWSPKVDMTNAKIMVDNSTTGAQYKGCALGGTAAAPRLYAADYGAAKVAVWDINLKPVLNGVTMGLPTKSDEGGRRKRLPHLGEPTWGRHFCLPTLASSRVLLAEFQCRRGRPS